MHFSLKTLGLWTFLALLSPISAVSEPLSVAPDAASRRAKQLGETVMSHSFSSVTSQYEKREGSRAFEMISSNRVGELIMKRGTKTMRAPIPEKQGAMAEGEYNRTSFFSHEGKIYVKEEMRSNLQGRIDDFLEFTGTYEAIVLEGSWDGFQKGEELVLRLCDDCQERYSSDIDEYTRNPRRLAALQKQIRKDFLATHRSIADKKTKEMPIQAEAINADFRVTEYVFQNANLSLAVSQSGQESVIYSVIGDKLTTRVGKSMMETRFSFSFP